MTVERYWLEDNRILVNEYSKEGLTSEATESLVMTLNACEQGLSASS